MNLLTAEELEKERVLKIMEQMKKIESGEVDVQISRPLTQQELEFEFLKRNKKLEELIEQND